MDLSVKRFALIVKIVGFATIKEKATTIEGVRVLEVIDKPRFFLWKIHFQRFKEILLSLKIEL